ncbi:unnamed protein product [Brassicogethes aeneus]|uniref:C2 domain-containing protein n=1 Tax=Brassicogethes aeneus TaxID=1431903 RepID=A0A9P0B3Y7_BRAAE|nr:unnamed protein product [Brassicogethes aeneus]
MEQKFNKLFNSLNINNKIGFGPSETDHPQIGFKVTYSENEKVLRIKVIGARKLPAVYGSIKPKGYLVKVTVFPEKEKFETKIVVNPTPIFNEEFIFPLTSPYTSRSDPLKGKFISFTIYANLEDEQETSGTTPKHVLKRFFSFNENNTDLVELRKKSVRTSGRKSYRNSLNNRRTVGAVTYYLDSKVFTQNISGKEVSTPDIWRTVKDITGGTIAATRDGNKGSVEISLQYAVSEDGNNDVVEISVTKFRCSVQTMQDHEKVGGQLYIKITAFEREDLVQKMKSDKFEPTISLKLDESTSTLRATVTQYNLNYVKILVRLISRNMVGKKEVLGKIEIDKNSEVWKEIVSKPSEKITRMMNLQ